MASEKCYCVYRHVFPNGKQYVGIAKGSPRRRWCRGNGYKSQFVYKAIQKYGWDNIEHEILRDGLSQDEAAMLEKKLIQRYDLRNPEKGYNVAPGGVGTSNWSEEAREKKRQWMLANAVTKGRHLTDEQKKWVSECNTGRKHTEEERQKMREHHWDVSGENNPNYGVACSEEKRQKLRNAHMKRTKAIEQYTLDGIFVARYQGVHEAVRQTGICRSSIHDCCTGRNGVKKTHGYVFKFATTEEEGAA